MACDRGTPGDELYSVGAAVHIVASNVGTNLPLPIGQPIELAFDRLLLPSTVTRQTIVVYPAENPNGAFLCTIAYDPVARVVSLNPLPMNGMPVLSSGQSYTVAVLSPSDPEDTSGLHAIDGATMDPDTPSSITFQVTAGAATPPSMCNGIVGPCMDFCSDIQPIFQSSCIAGTCHNGKIGSSQGGLVPGPTPDGLVLSDPPYTGAAILGTAINRLSVESTMGALAVPGPPSLHFGQDMPIIDSVTVTDPNTMQVFGPPGSGDPGNSYLMYKVLMAELGTLPMGTMALGNVYSVNWTPISDSERATLASYIIGREMPLAAEVSDMVNTGLPIDSLERLSLWIAQGAPVENCQ